MPAFSGMTNMSASFRRHSGESRNPEHHNKTKHLVCNKYLEQRSHRDRGIHKPVLICRKGRSDHGKFPRHRVLHCSQICGCGCGHCDQLPQSRGLIASARGKIERGDSVTGTARRCCAGGHLHQGGGETPVPRSPQGIRSNRLSGPECRPRSL